MNARNLLRSGEIYVSELKPCWYAAQEFFFGESITVELAAVHGVAGAAALLNQRNPDRQVDAATIRGWVRDYKRAEAFSLAILAAADSPMS